MKISNLFKTMLVLTAAALLRCSDETVTPQGPEEDFATSIEAYPSSLFVLEVGTLKSHPDNELSEPIEIFMQGSYGTILVNWGDGTNESVFVTERFSITHQYAEVKDYVIKISGDVGNISGVDIYYQHVNFRNLSLSGLKNLKDFGFGLNHTSPAMLNFSYNRQIEQVRLPGLQETSDIIIPSTNNISIIDISGENKLPTSVVDRVISRVYDSVKARPRAGSFDVRESWAQDESSDAMAGPPSSYSITKLRNLQNTYGWIITPTP